MLLINLVVVGLILWLAISFLFLAVNQRSESQLLLSSMEIEKNISTANDLLVRERRYFSLYVNSVQSGGTVLPSSIMMATINDTDSKLNNLEAYIADVVSQKKFIVKIPATPGGVKMLRARLSTLRQELGKKRDAVLSIRSNQPRIAQWRILYEYLNVQEKIQENLISFAESLKYLPDFSASSVENYYRLLNEALLLHVDLSEKNLSVQQVLNMATVSTTDLEKSFAYYNEYIDRRITDLVRLAQVSEKSRDLYPIALSLLKYYQTDYIRAEAKISDGYSSGKELSALLKQWYSISVDLNAYLKHLVDNTHESIDILIARSSDRANRNYLIDIVLVVLCFAITIASLMINRRVKRLAFFDNLTQLANRMNFESRLENLTFSKGQQHAVIFFDLDGFKSINDNYGRAIGDLLLMKVASRLRDNFEEAGVIARLGGDEFAVLMTDIPSKDAVQEATVHMAEAIERPIHVNELSLQVGVSAGFSIGPVDSADGTDLLRNADIAMYHTKSNKLSKVFRYNESIAAFYHQRLELEQDLRVGLESDEFYLVYQPKICTSTGQVKSVEALLRWRHGKRGSVSPAMFIPVAEETGMMGRIGRWALNEACREIAKIQKEHLPHLQVAVNISPQQFGDEQFVSSVCSAIEQNGLSYSSVSLEVTEGIVMKDIKRVVRMLKELQGRGIDIAVDDFGTGYSSLQYLQELPLNTLKIDRAFIVALDDTGAECSVANSIVQLAALFNLETVAEGVETVEQDAKIRALGVDHIQGYYYSKPLGAKELPAVVRSINEKHGKPGKGISDRAA